MVNVDISEEIKREIDKLIAVQLVKIANEAQKKVEDVLIDFDQALQKVRSAW